MENETSQAGEAAARFTQMWTELASKMAAAGMSFNPETPPTDAARQMRSAFFQAMSQQADQFMRSPEFLKMMKQSMDASLAFRKQMQDFFTSAHHAAGGVARQDVDQLLSAVHHLEDRLLQRIDELSTRLELLEKAVPSGNGHARKPPRRERKSDKAGTQKGNRS
jgi:hypothetical protein